MNTQKFFKSLVITALLIIVFPTTNFSQETIIPVSSTPKKIKSYITTHFPSASITLVKEEIEGIKKTYEIKLSDGTSLEFNKKMQIIDIDGVSKLPESVIPEKIRQYVTSNYPNNVITDWEIEGKNQQIELDNGLDLEFNKKGKFIRIDK